MHQYNHYIKGTYVPPASGAYFKNINPADKAEVVGLFAEGSAADINAAVAAAQGAFKAWSTMPAPQRGDLIYKAAEILLRRKEELAKVIVREMGKTLPESLGDIQSSVDAAQFCAGEGRRLYGQTTHSALPGRLAMTRRFPVGVCGLITAWNAPMAIIAWKLFPALICGNTVIIKPSEDAPLTAHYLTEVLAEAGFPPGVVNIVYGSGADAGRLLTEHAAVRLVSFTGSSRVGQAIAAECGKQMKRCSLELGGKNALIVMADADLAAAAKAVAAGAFSTAGQRCASTSRVVIDAPAYDEFMKLLLKETQGMPIGPGSDAGTKVCPIINERQYRSILKYIDDAKAQGAKLLHGGRALTDGVFAKGFYIEPTIFTDVSPQSALAQEEIFGPVLAVFKVNGFEEAMSLANGVRYGLTASIFTRDVNKSMAALERFEAGCCYVNGPTFGSEPHMPFGGWKASGIGTREPGLQAMDVFSEWKTIYVQQI